MLSGTFRSIDVTSITIAPDRQRQELLGIEELAESIRTVGLIHPIVITPEHDLVAGERRLQAHILLGYTHISAQYTTDLPREELEEIELEENLKRKSLGWQEEVLAVARLHAMRLKKNSNWKYADTALRLSLSRDSVEDKILVAEFIEKKEPLVLQADTYSTARNICIRKRQREAAVESDKLSENLSTFMKKPVSLAPMKTKETEPALPLEEAPQPDIPYRHCDFREWAGTPWDGPKFNFIHCDFPYGINFDKHAGGATGLLGAYEDSPELYQQCLASLRACMEDRVSESAHLMFWLSARQDILQPSMETLEGMGWKINQVPLIWHRSDNSGILPDPARGPRQVYEVCLFGSRGDRKIVQAVSNLFAHPKTKDVHASEKPRAMLQHFFRMFVDEHTVMLDPTMGSGNSILAAEESSPNFVLGLEALEEIFKNAVEYRKLVKRRD